MREKFETWFVTSGQKRRRGTRKTVLTPAPPAGSPSRGQARVTLGGEFPSHALFRFVQRVPNSTMVHVSCSPSKIPYVGFSPVRLQTGIQLRASLTGSWLKCEAHMHHKLDNLYATKAEKPCSCGPKACLTEPDASTALPVQRPLALQALCCHSGSSPNMASSETVYPFRRLIFFARRVFALRPRMGWNRQLPQFAPRTCHIVPSSVPRRSVRVHLVVSSPNVLAFATLASARQPQSHTRRFLRGCVTRLQSSLYATARYLASPSPARTFTIELSPDGSPQSDVDYNYTIIQPIIVAGLPPARYAALWAAS
jgi:hypothetical protein